MKGIVFTEFLDFVGAKLGPDLLDDIIDDAALPNGGAYTAVGTYPYQEMGALVGALSRRTETAVPLLLTRFGNHLCKRFAEKFPEFFETHACLFDFLASVDNHVHVEVLKLYPDAELPTFRLIPRDERTIDFEYESCRPLEALAEGLIVAAADYYGEPITLERTRIDEPGRAFVRFSIRLAAGKAAGNAVRKTADITAA